MCLFVHVTGDFRESSRVLIALRFPRGCMTVLAVKTGGDLEGEGDLNASEAPSGQGHEALHHLTAGSDRGPMRGSRVGGCRNCQAGCESIILCLQ